MADGGGQSDMVAGSYSHLLSFLVLFPPSLLLPIPYLKVAVPPHERKLPFWESLCANRMARPVSGVAGPASPPRVRLLLRAAALFRLFSLLPPT